MSGLVRSSAPIAANWVLEKLGSACCLALGEAIDKLENPAVGIDDQFCNPLRYILLTSSLAFAPSSLPLFPHQIKEKKEEGGKGPALHAFPKELTNKEGQIVLALLAEMGFAEEEAQAACIQKLSVERSKTVYTASLTRWITAPPQPEARSSSAFTWSGWVVAALAAAAACYAYFFHPARRHPARRASTTRSLSKRQRLR